MSLWSRLKDAVRAFLRGSPEPPAPPQTSRYIPPVDWSRPDPPRAPAQNPIYARPDITTVPAVNMFGQYVPPNLPDHWDTGERSMYVHLTATGVDNEVYNDDYLRAAYDYALFSDLRGDDFKNAMDSLKDYLMDEYDIYFTDVWEWESYREWYDTTH